MLDAGCGHGGILLELRGWAGVAVGVDCDAAALAENYHLDHTVVADIAALPFPDATFDLIVCEWVLEHVAAPERALRELARVLRPRGAFVAYDAELSAPVGAAHAPHVAHRPPPLEVFTLWHRRR